MKRWVLLVLMACTADTPKAEDPYWGKQACAHCAMLVTDKAPAAQALLENGQRKFFDDLGCMAAWEAREAPHLKGHWVRTPANDGWLSADAARFSTGHVTPMDFGFLPTAEGVSFEEVRADVVRKTRRAP